MLTPTARAWRIDHDPMQAGHSSRCEAAPLANTSTVTIARRGVLKLDNNGASNNR